MEFFDRRLFLLICGIKDGESPEATGLIREAEERIATDSGIRVMAAFETRDAETRIRSMPERQGGDQAAVDAAGERDDHLLPGHQPADRGIQSL